MATSYVTVALTPLSIGTEVHDFVESLLLDYVYIKPVSREREW